MYPSLLLYPCINYNQHVNQRYWPRLFLPCYFIPVYKSILRSIILIGPSLTFLLFLPCIKRLLTSNQTVVRISMLVVICSTFGVIIHMVTTALILVPCGPFGAVEHEGISKIIALDKLVTALRAWEVTSLLAIWKSKNQ